VWTRRRFNFRSRFEGGSKVAVRVDGVHFVWTRHRFNVRSAIQVTSKVRLNTSKGVVSCGRGVDLTFEVVSKVVRKWHFVWTGCRFSVRNAIQVSSGMGSFRVALPTAASLSNLTVCLALGAIACRSRRTSCESQNHGCTATSACRQDGGKCTYCPGRLDMCVHTQPIYDGRF